MCVNGRDLCFVIFFDSEKIVFKNVNGIYELINILKIRCY